MTAIRFILNGEPRAEEAVPPTMTVLDWLRTRARLTGAKEGCAEGDCGACTIAIAHEGGDAPQWQAVNSCLMMLPQLDGYRVLTVEGLAPPGGPLHPIQQALVDADATQCGFCTPGFVMAMFAFREGGEPANDALIHEALAGNLCRCTGYRAIVEACRRAVAQKDDVAPGTYSEHGSDLVRPSRPAFGGRLRMRGPEIGTSAVAGKDAHAKLNSPHPEVLGIAEPRRTHTPTCSAYSHSDQTFLAPTSLAELLDLRAQHPEAILLAGGTDLGLRVSKEREALPLVVSTAKLAELKEIAITADTLTLGGAVTYTEALPYLDAHFPAFGELVRRIGSRQIRNLGTLAGNLATASPIGDTLPVLIALDARVTLASQSGERTLTVEHFITGYRQTALAADEIIRNVHIPLVPEDEAFAAYKLSKRFDQDISTVVAAFLLRLQDGKLAALRTAFGGMAAQVKRASATERALTGRAWTQESLADVDQLLARDFAPLSDHRGSAAYRLRAAIGLLRRLQIETASQGVPTRVEAL